MSLKIRLARAGTSGQHHTTRDMRTRAIAGNHVPLDMQMTQRLCQRGSAIPQGNPMTVGLQTTLVGESFALFGVFPMPHLAAVTPRLTDTDTSA